MWATLDWDKISIPDKVAEDVVDEIEWLDILYGLPNAFYTKMELYEYVQEKRELIDELRKLED